MIYLKIVNANMKTTSQTIRYSFWGMLGIIIVLTNLTPILAKPTLQENTATPAAKITTTAATPGTKNEAGSTDGIMIVALVIVLIVIIPILLKRQAWENGKKDKTAPPS